MGEVLLAYDPLLERRVALKILHDTRDAHEHPTSVEYEHIRLKREGRALARVCHPNVVEVYDVGECEGGVYMALDFVEGRTLRQWFAEHPGNWRELTNIMLQIGRGLAAAHRGDIVHRDFKPDNAMVDHKGHATVVDFGIATGVEELRPDRSGVRLEIRSDPITPGRSPHDSGRLTRDGTVVGTPQYMAPEQYASGDCDHRGDIYAFCVTYFEGLHGRRPMEARDPRPSHGHEPVPVWLDKLVRRGLAADPDDRPASMDELVQEIEHRLDAPTRRRRTIGSIGSSFVALFGLCMVALSALPNNGPDPCPDPSPTWRSVWNPKQRTTIQRAFEATGASWAKETSRRVAEHLDGHVADWVAIHESTCRAAHVEGSLAPADLERAQRCLRVDVARHRTLVEAFAKADYGVVESAVEALRSIPEVEECRRTQQLKSALPWPESLARLHRVEKLRERLAEVRALQLAGRWQQSKEQLGPLIEEAVAIDFRPVLAEVHLTASLAATQFGRHEDAVEWLRLSIRDAIAGRHPSFGAYANERLAEIYGQRLRQPDTALSALDRATMYSKAAGRPAWIEARIARTRASLLAAGQDYHGAVAQFTRTLDLARDLYDSRNPLVAQARTGLAIATYFVGNHEDAHRLFQVALNQMETYLVPDHPQLSSARSNQASMLLMDGELVAAARAGALALNGCVVRQGDEALACASERLVQANALMALSRFREAVAVLEPAVAAQDRAGRRGDPFIGWAHARLGDALVKSGELERGLEMARRGHQLSQRDPQLADGWRVFAAISVAAAARANGDLNAARSLLESLADQLPEDAALASFARLGYERELAHTELAEGQALRACETHQRHLQRTNSQSHPIDRAGHDLDIARSCARAGKLAIARTHSQRGRDAVIRHLGAEHRTLTKHLLIAADLALAESQPDEALRLLTMADDRFDAANMDSRLSTAIAVARERARYLRAAEASDPLTMRESLERIQAALPELSPLRRGLTQRWLDDLRP